jgi:hypothetical protein
MYLKTIINVCCINIAKHQLLTINLINEDTKFGGGIYFFARYLNKLANTVGAA